MEVIAAYGDAERRGDMGAVAVWASEAIDLITECRSAREIANSMVTDAEATLRRVLPEP